MRKFGDLGVGNGDFLLKLIILISSKIDENDEDRRKSLGRPLDFGAQIGRFGIPK